MESRPAALTVAVLAGGQSSRMGTDKAFVRVLGRPLIELVLEPLQGLGAETLIITNHPEPYRYLGLPLFPDVLPAMGALGGLYSALHYSTQPHTLCAACDMPFVVPALLDYLLALRADADAVIPRLPAAATGALEAEPFRAVYARAACLGPIRAALDAGRRRVITWFPDVRVRFVEAAEIDRLDPRRLSFINVNTPQDLEAARQLPGG